MHLRRALLLFALVLGLTALAASIAPAPRSQDATAPTQPPAPAAAPEGTLSLTFRAPPGHGGAPARRVSPGAHVVVEVAATEAGQATIPALGRADSVTPDSPGRFDLIEPASGRYDVMFAPALGSPVRVGTLVTSG